MKLLTLRDAAERLGVSIHAIRHMVAECTLPVIRISARRLRIDEAVLAAWIDRRTIHAVGER